MLVLRLLSVKYRIEINTPKLRRKGNLSKVCRKINTPHTHTGYEEFLVIEGELIDVDNTVFKKGDFITFEPGSKHSSYTEKGALLMVFQRGINKPIK